MQSDDNTWSWSWFISPALMSITWIAAQWRTTIKNTSKIEVLEAALAAKDERDKSFQAEIRESNKAFQASMSKMGDSVSSLQISVAVLANEAKHHTNQPQQHTYENRDGTHHFDKPRPSEPASAP